MFASAYIEKCCSYDAIISFGFMLWRLAKVLYQSRAVVSVYFFWFYVMATCKSIVPVESCGFRFSVRDVLFGRGVRSYASHARMNAGPKPHVAYMYFYFYF